MIWVSITINLCHFCLVQFWITILKYGINCKKTDKFASKRISIVRKRDNCHELMLSMFIEPKNKVCKHLVPCTHTIELRVIENITWQRYDKKKLFTFKEKKFTDTRKTKQFEVSRRLFWNKKLEKSWSDYGISLVIIWNYTLFFYDKHVALT